MEKKFGEVASPAFTQGGIGEMLGVRQGTLAKLLSRLAATGVVTSDRRHVSGEPRRRNVYQLTALGESIARDLRRRALSAVPTGGVPAGPPRVTVSYADDTSSEPAEPRAPSRELVRSN